MKVTGTVTYVDLSGGFWGIVSDDGQQLNPLGGIPASLQKEGLRVQADCSPSSDFSIFMWGTNINIKKIEKL